MEGIREAQGARRAYLPAALFLGSSAVLAALTAQLLWSSLPYVRFAGYTPADRFALWEGFVWLIALVVGFLGLAAVLQVVGWNLGAGVAELQRRLTRPGSDPLLVTAAAVLAWWMIGYSLFLIIGATAARSFVGS